MNWDTTECCPAPTFGQFAGQLSAACTGALDLGDGVGRLYSYSATEPPVGECTCNDHQHASDLQSQQMGAELMAPSWDEKGGSVMGSHCSLPITF